MKKNHLKKGLMLIATSVFVLALPVLASAKSALDDYVGKWNKVETNHSISITGDKGGVIDENSIKNTGEKFFEASAWTGPDKRSTLSIRGTKPGKGTVSFKYKYKGKTKTYKLKIQVVKYVCPVKMISFGDFKFKASKKSLLANMGSTRAKINAGKGQERYGDQRKRKYNLRDHDEKQEDEKALGGIVWICVSDE